MKSETKNEIVNESGSKRENASESKSRIVSERSCDTPLTPSRRGREAEGAIEGAREPRERKRVKDLRW